MTAIVNTDVLAVVGAGLSGLRTVEQLRRRGYDGRIILFGAERHLPYDRPPLSKQVLRGERDDAWLRRDNDFSGLDVELRLDEAVTGVDTGRSVLLTADGEEPYGTLVIATGAVPRRIPGIDGHVLRTLDDAQGLRERLKPGTRLVVIGAGLIGCEVAASARALDVDVELVDVLDGPMIRVVGPEVAGVVADLHRRHGVGLHMAAGVESSADGLLRLADGSELGYDVILEAIGASPDVAWLSGSSLTVENGIMCDGAGRAADNVYAVGDVSNWNGHRHEHWTNATYQAEVVAATITGHELPPDSLSYWWSDQYDLKIQGMGMPGPDDDVHVLQWGPKQRTVAVYSAAGRLTGLVGFSAAPAIMKLRSQISDGADVTGIIEQLSV